MDAIDARRISPIRYIRDLKGLTIRGAAESIGCNYQALYLNEIGCYSSILPTTLVWLVNETGWTEEDLNAAYKYYIQVSRDWAKDMFSWETVNLTALGSPGDNPIIKFREYFDLSRAGLCKVLKIPIQSLYVAENPDSPRLVTKIPPQLIRVLRQMGVSSDVLMEMEDRYVDWYAGVKCV